MSVLPPETIRVYLYFSVYFMENVQVDGHTQLSSVQIIQDRSLFFFVANVFVLPASWLQAEW